MISLRSKVRWLAIYSRGFVLILQLLSNLTLPDHAPTDTFTWITVNPPSSSSSTSPSPSSPTVLDQFVSFLLDGFVRWDAHYFLHVSNNGYTYENTLAFFPLYPLLVQTVANGIHWFTSDLDAMTYVTLLKISACYVNLIAFVVSADVLYSLSRRVLRDEYLAYKAALLFCLNPASVFFSAPYSEAVFALFTFSAMLAAEKGLGLWSGVFLALSSATRSNGILNAGFVVYKSMKVVATQTILYVRAKKDKKKAATPPRPAEAVTGGILPGVVNIVMGLGSFAAFQWYSYDTFCRRDREDMEEFPAAVVRAAEDNGFVMPGDRNGSWCDEDPPIAYRYVQSHYWDVGFLRYWEAKQYPQFLLAAPVIGLLLWQLYLFLQAHFKYSLRLGLVDNTQLGLSKPRDRPPTATLSLPRNCLPYVLHAAALALFSLLFIHVQVSTRLLCSSSPVLYWFCALLTTPSEADLVAVEPDKELLLDKSKVWLKVEKASNLENRHSTILLQESGGGDASNWVKMYFLGYTLLGTVLFSNNYPWT